MGKISVLPAIVTIDDLDVFPVVDVSDGITKKMTFGQMHTAQMFPYLMQSDTTDQAIVNPANAQLITFDTDIYHQDITRTSSSRFTIVDAAAYLITFSGLAQSAVAGKIIGFWLKVSGTDVVGSLTNYTFKSTGATAVIAASFIQVFTAGQYLEFWTWGDDSGCKWDATAAAGSPTRPACPSIIITVNKISA